MNSINRRLYFMQHLIIFRHQTEHLMAERNKLKADLTEVNNRIIILVKEGDDRYTLLEKSKEKEKEYVVPLFCFLLM